MAKARAGKEIHVIGENKIGTLADISQWLADKQISVKSACAYVDNGKAHFLFITSDNKKAMEILRGRELTVSEEDVVIVEMPDKIGMLKDAAKKLKTADIDIKHVYGTTSGTVNAVSFLVFDCDDNKKAINTING